MKKVWVWDAWVRLFHWLLVIALTVSFYTMKTGGYPLLFPVDWHARAGYSVLGLMLFRWLWGVFGSRHARFFTFLRSPRTLWDYARQFLHGKEALYAGHNPLGGWMVLLMLVSLTLQAGSGLFLHDDILFEAPLYGSVGSQTTRNLAIFHNYNGNFLLILILLHIAAVGIHRLKGERLVGAMFHGRKRLAFEPVDGPGSHAVNWRALVCGALALGVVVWLWNS
ncbi:Cytochrome b [Modicisalibacter ilicicola DSM 19980]|uniref:Cytochrome b n=1 Tax=Modicisalibacter ilicicola DSM 19980 TaxID=1121942 RepID=A0A1M4XJ29_9GAMM|nr:cytochrome b/b6 domain-containing protein [Halomonas ilicicola]SHE93515.1 Cytochrome b [Halomonas ilicicola DSM 19980]